MITQRKAEQNIFAIYKQALPEHRREGIAWYQHAHNYCEQLAAIHHTETWKVVAALAVMSPNCSWDTNKKAVASLLASNTVAGNVYPANIVKARYYLTATDCNIENLTQAKRSGNKVRAFFDNILLPSTSQRATIDTHAIRAAFDKYEVTKQQQQWVFNSLGGYTVLENAYKAIAKKVTLRPNQLQAIVWLATKHSIEVSA